MAVTSKIAFGFLPCLFVIILCSASSARVLGLIGTGRIVGGIAAPTNAAPYIVSFQYKNQHYCAGSIINANWVLTAAHCLSPETQILATQLVAGSNDVHGTASTTQKRSVKSYVIHKLYNGGAVPYDIGLVYTATAFTWTSAVKAVSLPSASATPTGYANLFGWGSTSTSSIASYPTMLQEAADIPIISLSSCEAALGAKGADVHETNICTGPLTGGVSICTSDSGGPLVQSSGSSTNVLVGIVSWGKTPCGQANSPSVYVKVSSFISWIKQNQIVT